MLGLLFQMNDAQNVNRSLGLSNSNVGVTNRVHEIDADYPDDAQAIRRMFLATLTRYPTDRELALMLDRRSRPPLPMAQRPAMGAAQQAGFRVPELRPP